MRRILTKAAFYALRPSAHWVVLCLLAGGMVPASGELVFRYNRASRVWNMDNAALRAEFRITPEGKFGLTRLTASSGYSWISAGNNPTSPIKLQIGEASYDSNSSFQLVREFVQVPNPTTERQVIVLRDPSHLYEFRVELEMYTGQPVIRQRVFVTNQSSAPQFVTSADMLPYAFATAGEKYSLFRVQQWAVAPRPADFLPRAVALAPGGTAPTLLTGSGGEYCAWMAVANDSGNGLFAAWEFDGQSRASTRIPDDGTELQLSARMRALHHPVQPNATFQVPAAFLGTFRGGWDDAGYRTQRFSEAVLAKPAPPGFPYVSWDSWAYNTELNETVLRQNADAAARLGIELFIVDLGWARDIGDWREDPLKFPSGLRALSDYVHGLGMKFGLHFALAEAAADSPVLRENPDWTASVSDNYYGALSLCLANQPTRDWLIQQAVQMIDRYGLDYILQDGQNIVKTCTKTTHTHDAADSNYENSVNGINAVIAAVQQLRPNVLWENCENGGNMMTFNMVQEYVTSITNDASGALGSRQGVFGATYPFSPRYADRYMPETPSNTYITRSYEFGGPWHFMNRLTEMDSGAMAFAAAEIGIYKIIRGSISAGQVFHLSVAPNDGHTDALESHNPASDASVTIAVRDNTGSSISKLRIQGHAADRTYLVHFQEDSRVLTLTGRQLSEDGIDVNLPQARSGEIVYVDPLNP